MEFHEEICKFCLEKCDSSKPIDGSTKHVFDVLLPKIDFSVTQEPVMCESCAEMLIKCFNFKATCLRTFNHIVPFVNKKDNVKLDLTDVYLNEDVTGTGVPEGQDICVFCMGVAKKCHNLFFDVEEGDRMLKKMVEQCLPEIDLNVFKKPVICAPCHGSLENCFRFVTNCLNVGEKTKKYCETLDIDSKGQIELSKIGGKSVDIIKVEEQFCEYRDNPDKVGIDNGGNIIKLENMFFDDRKDVNEDVENKYESFTEIDYQRVNNEHQVTPENMYACEKECNKLGSIKKEEIFCEDKTKGKEENFVEMEDHKFLLDEEIEIKTDKQDSSEFEDAAVLPYVEVTTKLHGKRESSVSNLDADLLKHEDPLNVTMYKCESCSYQTKHYNGIKKHALVHMDPLSVTLYKCGFCSFETKYNQSLKSHLLKHKDPSEVTMHKCESCSFETKYSRCLKKHLLIHKGPLEVTVYKCDTCSFQTKHKNSLKYHLLIHKALSELTMYKCASCLFQTKYKSDLKKHLLKHTGLKDPSGVTMYKCDSCSYQTKNKKDLKKHSLTHVDSLNVTLYKCDFCSFETKYKECLDSHLLVHKDTSKVTMYKCESCSFKTKYSRCLKKHLLIHKGPLEVTVYKCDSCSFQTKHKHSLKDHLLIHKAPSEITMYKCASCLFQTKYKGDLKKHLLKHTGLKDPSGVTLHKCDSCSYQTKYRQDLKKHSLMHVDPLNVTLYKCDFCSFETKYKECLHSHLLVHKDPSEVTMYKCDSCAFETKYSWCLKKHLLLHKDPLEVSVQM